MPEGGEPNIDLWYADDPGGAEDTPITALDGDTQLTVVGGAWTLGNVLGCGSIPADKYLYLVVGSAAADKYSAGKFLIELIGTI